MNATPVTRFYDRLRPPERFRLLLEAAAREDDVEVNRLQQTTPEKTYTMPDAEVRQLLVAGERCALTWALVWTVVHRSYLVAVSMDWEDPKVLPDGVDLDTAQRARGYRVSELAGTYEGLIRFCRRVGVEPEVLIKAWLPHVWEEVNDHREMLDLHRGMHDNSAFPGCCDSGLGWCKIVEREATLAECGLCRRWPGLNDVADELEAKFDELVARSENDQPEALPASKGKKRRSREAVGKRRGRLRKARSNACG